MLSAYSYGLQALLCLSSHSVGAVLHMVRINMIHVVSIANLKQYSMELCSDHFTALYIHCATDPLCILGAMGSQGANYTQEHVQ